MRKIIVLGLTGSGKTTFSNKLGKLLNVPVFYLDQYFWKENWQHVSQSEFLNAQENIVRENESWIMDGSFPRSKSLDFRIYSADTIIFFDFPIYVPLFRMAKRYFQLMGKERPDVGSGNKQKRPFGWEDVIYAKNYPRKDLLKKIEEVCVVKSVFVFRSDKDVKKFLKSLHK